MEANRLYRKNLAAEGRLPARPESGVPPAKLCLALLYDLCCKLSEEPHAFALGGDRTVTVFFRDSCYACADLLQEYREILAAVNSSWPIAVYGVVGGAEVGELRCEREGETLHWIKSNVTGKDFDLLSDLCVQITTSCAVECELLTEAVSRMSDRRSCAAVHRRYEALCRTSELTVPVDSAHFLYLPLGDSAESGDRLESLTVELKAELWEEYLLDGVSCLEFEWFMEDFADGTAQGLLEWELALRMVLPRLGITVENGPEQFRITGSDGKPMRLSYVTAPAAGRLFLKLLFPARPGTTR